MDILAIESSCDDTSVSIVRNGRSIISHHISSQMKLHAKHGGVVPEIASRRHAEIIHYLIDKTLEDADIESHNIDAFAVTYGPGLEGALLIGVIVAKTLSKLLKKPLIPVNHLHGHIYAHFLEKSPPPFPFIGLIASGGHTILCKVNHHCDIQMLGQTRDDAAGEAFDKIARFLGLPYPGGPAIEKMALDGNSAAFSFPIGLKNSPYEFSFSGLKTAVIQACKNYATTSEIPVADVCASFQSTVIDTLWHKTKEACNHHHISHIALCGGVMANQALQKTFLNRADKDALTIHNVEPILCTDNAAMIAAAAYYAYTFEKKINTAFFTTPNLAL
jgi:N6-L-threonylcarbamoyladenine synthase